MTTENGQYRITITSRHRLLDLHLAETLQYRDLIALFVKRDFVSKYKQTILGPLWAIIQPLLTTVVFTIVFGNLARLTTYSRNFLLSLYKVYYKQEYYGEGVLSTAGRAYCHGTFKRYFFCHSIGSVLGELALCILLRRNEHPCHVYSTVAAPADPADDGPVSGLRHYCFLCNH